MELIVSLHLILLLTFNTYFMQLKSIDLLRMVLGVVNCSDTFDTLTLLLSRLAKGEGLNFEANENYITISIRGNTPTAQTGITINKSDF